MWSLVIVTAPDEQERCCVLVDGLCAILLMRFMRFKP
jgi:hypothetical protein